MFQPATRFGLGLLLVTSTAQQSYAENPAAGRQVEQALELEEGSVKQVPYLLYLPQGYGQEQGKKWPLVLFLHGRGESYGPLSLVTKWGLPKQKTARLAHRVGPPVNTGTVPGTLPSQATTAVLGSAPKSIFIKWMWRRTRNK